MGRSEGGFDTFAPDPVLFRIDGEFRNRRRQPQEDAAQPRLVAGDVRQFQEPGHLDEVARPARAHEVTQPRLPDGLEPRKLEVAGADAHIPGIAGHVPGTNPGASPSAFAPQHTIVF